ncbi:adenine phosphoribosyltransferase [bacterium]|nr:adenine phosphoribosyltransferase [bacterium]
MEELKKIIRDVPDFPKPGIMFKDVTPLLMNPEAFKKVTQIFTDKFSGEKITKVLGIDARGFIFGAPVALNLNVGFVPVRKAGKLPWTKISEEYVLEYGKDKLEIHADAVQPGDRVVIIDDLLATGGTAGAVANMVQKLKAQVVSVAFVVELGFLEGRKKLNDWNIFSIINY